MSWGDVINGATAKVEETPYTNVLNVRWTPEALSRFIELWNNNGVHDENGSRITLAFVRDGDDVTLTATEHRP